MIRPFLSNFLCNFIMVRPETGAIILVFLFQLLDAEVELSCNQEKIRNCSNRVGRKFLGLKIFSLDIKELRKLRFSSKGCCLLHMCSYCMIPSLLFLFLC